MVFLPRTFLVTKHMPHFEARRMKSEYVLRLLIADISGVFLCVDFKGYES